MILEGKMKVLIYALCDPVSKEIRYVGKTTERNFKNRMKLHLYNKEKTYRSNWIQSLKLNGLKPDVFILETCEGAWESVERFWISYLRFIGCRLTNLSPGGDNFIATPESRKKLSESLKGRIFSEEHRKKIGDANRIRVYSNETRKKISDSLIGRVHNSEKHIQATRSRSMGNKYACGIKFSNEALDKIGINAVKNNFKRWHHKEFLTCGMDYLE